MVKGMACILDCLQSIFHSAVLAVTSLLRQLPRAVLRRSRKPTALQRNERAPVAVQVLNSFQPTAEGPLPLLFFINTAENACLRQRSPPRRPLAQTTLCDSLRVAAAWRLHSLRRGIDVAPPSLPCPTNRLSRNSPTLLDPSSRRDAPSGSHAVQSEVPKSNSATSSSPPPSTSASLSRAQPRRSFS